jgi:hypothetical protein
MSDIQEEPKTSEKPGNIGNPSDLIDGQMRLDFGD